MKSILKGGWKESRSLAESWISRKYTILSKRQKRPWRFKYQKSLEPLRTVHNKIKLCIQRYKLYSLTYTGFSVFMIHCTYHTAI